jgi:hypothetical protein
LLEAGNITGKKDEEYSIMDPTIPSILYANINIEEMMNVE